MPMIKLGMALLVLLISTPGTAAEHMGMMRDLSNDADKGMGVITGQVISKDKIPLVNGTVVLYNKAVGPPPSLEDYLKIPNSMGSTDNSGKFSIKVLEGTYYLAALKWAFESKDVGPPKHGDPLYLLRDEKGNFKEVSIKAGSVVDIGIIRQTGNFDKNKERFGKGITAVEGFVIDTEGKPVEGAIVMAAVDNKLLFASYKTGKDGKFLVRTNDGGTYYLKVTNRYGGGRPAEGEQLLVPEEGVEDTPVLLKKGQRVKAPKLKVKKIIMTDQMNKGQPVMPQH